jgi:uncharacterized lipoprotein YddW (UPF0748 family)
MQEPRYFELMFISRSFFARSFFALPRKELDRIRHDGRMKSGLFSKVDMNACVRYLILLLLFTLAACIPDGFDTEGHDNTIGNDNAVGEDNATQEPIEHEDAGRNDGGDDVQDVQDVREGASNDTSDADTDDATELEPNAEVEVSHEREVRGVWVPTVFNISWPSRSGLTAQAQKRELTALMETARRAGLNTVYFQIRGEADALYASQIEPWSRFLSGTMGQSPGYDPLEFAIVEAHKRGLEFHAWLNPYRALTTSNTSVASAGHIVKARPDLVVRYGNLYWMDPGLEAVRDHTLAVVRDVLTRYDIDGLHFDDYFYPYPNGDPFPDGSTYAAYQAAGGTLSLGDFRRNNVNLLVEAVHHLVRELRPDVRFGISPFGIYRPGIPPGTTGLDQYDAIYSDPLRWLEGGWVDYLAPQLYWPTTQTAQAYGALLDWWSARAAEAGKDLYVGNYTSQLGSSPAWTVEEILEQIRLTRAARDQRALGNIHYHINPITANRLGLTDALVRDFYGSPVAAPPIPGTTGRPPSPQVHVADDGITFDHDGQFRYIAVYQNGALIRLVPAAAGRFGLARGDYLVSLIDRHDRESLAIPITVSVDIDDPIESPPAGLSCVHSFGGTYAHTGCSASYQCCDGLWRQGHDSCGPCSCVEATGQVGC